MNSRRPAHFIQKSDPIWKHMDNEIILASGLRLLRNLHPFKFVSTLDHSSRLQMTKFITSALMNTDLFHKSEIFQGKEILGDDKELIFERFFFLDAINQITDHESLVLDESGCFLSLINRADHLQLITITPGESIDHLLTKLMHLENELSQHLDFAFSRRFGFLSAYPHHCGTGLIGNMLLHLPALVQTQQLPAIMAEYSEEQVHIRGFINDNYLADLIVLENKHTLGISEEKIVANLQSLASRLAIAEVCARSELQSKGSFILMDRITRAYGLIQHSLLLDTHEAMQSLSLIKLGALCGWIKGMNIQRVHGWLFDVQKAHLNLKTLDLAKPACPTAHATPQEVPKIQVANHVKPHAKGNSLPNSDVLNFVENLSSTHNLMHKRALALHPILKKTRLLID